MPFDRFTIDQIAGDLRPEDSFAERIATGFHRNTQINQEGGIDVEQFRVDSIVDRVNTTGTVFLGLTIACASVTTTSLIRSPSATTTSSSHSSTMSMSLISRSRRRESWPGASRCAPRLMTCIVRSCHVILISTIARRSGKRRSSSTSRRRKRRTFAWRSICPERNDQRPSAARSSS